jgi:hypothetical protein
VACGAAGAGVELFDWDAGAAAALVGPFAAASTLEGVVGPLEHATAVVATAKQRMSRRFVAVFVAVFIQVTSSLNGPR